MKSALEKVESKSKMSEKGAAKVVEDVLYSKPRMSAVKRFLVANGIYRGTVKTRSSSIEWVRYHRGQRTLDVAFVNGSVYRYFDVQPQDVKSFLGADSLGRAFNKILRNEFEYQLIRGRRKPPVSVQKLGTAAKIHA